MPNNSENIIRKSAMQSAGRKCPDCKNGQKCAKCCAKQRRN